MAQEIPGVPMAPIAPKQPAGNEGRQLHEKGSAAGHGVTPGSIHPAVPSDIHKVNNAGCKE